MWTCGDESRNRDEQGGKIECGSLQVCIECMDISSDYRLLLPFGLVPTHGVKMLTTVNNPQFTKIQYSSLCIPANMARFYNR